MTFVKFEVQTKAKLAAGTGLTASLRKGKKSPARLTLQLRPAVVARMVGWDDKVKLAVYLGEEESHGIIRLELDASGTAMLERRNVNTGHGDYFSVDLGHVPNFIDRNEGKRWCKWEAIADATMELVLPSWADETSPKAKQRAVAPRPNPPMSAPPARLTDVTRVLMGDPGPGRSALRDQALAREAPGYAAAEAKQAAREQEEVNRVSRTTLAFHVTPSQARLLLCMLDGNVKTKEMLLTAAQGENPDDHSEDLKIVDVWVSKMRKGLLSRGVEIETVWGQGLRMDAKSIARFNAEIAGDLSEPDQQEAANG